MFSLIISVFILALSVLITRRIVSKIDKPKKSKIILSITIFLVLSIVASTGVDMLVNRFCSFSSPESAFKFSYFGDVIDTVEGEDSCMIIYRKSQSHYGQAFYLKSEDGKYKEKADYKLKTVANTVYEKGSVTVYNIKGTEDYYVLGYLITADSAFSIYNNKEESLPCIIFEEVNEYDNQSYQNIIFYECISDFTNDYYLAVDEYTIRF